MRTASRRRWIGSLLGWMSLSLLSGLFAGYVARLRRMRGRCGRSPGRPSTARPVARRRTVADLWDGPVPRVDEGFVTFSDGLCQGLEIPLHPAAGVLPPIRLTVVWDPKTRHLGVFPGWWTVLDHQHLGRFVIWYRIEVLTSTLMAQPVWVYRRHSDSFSN